MSVLKFPTARKRRYPSPALSDVAKVPANVHDLWADHIQRIHDAENELITVEITRGLFNAIRRMQSFGEAG